MSLEDLFRISCAEVSREQVIRSDAFCVLSNVIDAHSGTRFVRVDASTCFMAAKPRQYCHLDCMLSFRNGFFFVRSDLPATNVRRGSPAKS